MTYLNLPNLFKILFQTNCPKFLNLDNMSQELLNLHSYGPFPVISHWNNLIYELIISFITILKLLLYKVLDFNHNFPYKDYNLLQPSFTRIMKQKY